MYITDCTLCILLIVPCVHYRWYLVYITDRTLCILQVVHIDLTTDEMARVTHIVVVVPTSENDDKVSLYLTLFHTCRYCHNLNVYTNFYLCTAIMIPYLFAAYKCGCNGQKSFRKQIICMDMCHLYKYTTHLKDFQTIEYVLTNRSALRSDSIFYCITSPLASDVREGDGIAFNVR